MIWHRTPSLLLAIAVGALSLMAIATACGLRINTTGSMPVGLYLAVNRPATVGDVVSFCPPDEHVFQIARARSYIGPGDCPGGYEHLMKRLLAAKGDRVAITAQGVSINNHLVPGTAPLHSDTAGRSLPDRTGERFTVPGGQVLMLSSYNSKSFDGRYFGLVPRSALTSVLQPLWTTNGRR